MDLDKLKNELARQVGDMTRDEAHAQGVCLLCKQAALPKCATVVDVREYRLSAICGQCWDRVIDEAA
jgi:peptide deformylase